MPAYQRKGIFMLLSSSLLFSALPAYADSAPAAAEKVMVKTADQTTMQNVKISKEKALETAKNAVEIPDDYVQRNVEFQSMWWASNTPAWIFYWDRQGQDFGNIQVAVDANSGSILNIEVYKNHQSDSPSYPPKTDVEQAKQLALEYIKAHFPDKVEQIHLDDQMTSGKPPLSGVIQYPLVFKRTVNGIVFENNEIRVTVDGNGEIVGFAYRWSDNIEFPDAAQLITQEEAQKIYANHLNLSLRLLPYFGVKQNNQQDFLTYMPAWLAGVGPYPPTFIQASDGAFVTPWGDKIDPNQIQTIPIASEKIGALANGSNLKQDEALQVIKKYFPIPEEILMRANYREQNADSPASVWDFNWEVQGDGMSKGWSSASLDAKTGRILNYYSGDQVLYEKGLRANEKYEQKISKAEGEKLAIDLVKTLNPDITDQIYLIQTPANPHEMANSRIYNYQFTVVKNKVSLENAGVGVSVDSSTGKISNYWFNVQNLNLPDQAPDVISTQDAKQAYLSMTNMRLTYILPQEKPSISSKNTSTATKALLVYQPLLKQVDEPMFLDAKTGHWASRETGKPYFSETNVTDILGNPHEKELRILLRYNVFDVKEGKIYPNEEISRGEMIKILMLVQNNGYHGWIDPNRKATFNDVAKESAYYSYVENAVDQKLIDASSREFKPDEKINREELAELIVRCLGYYSLLDVPGLFTIDLKDASSLKNPATAELVTKLGIMDTKEGSFLGQGPVSRAEAAAAFYRYLMKRSNPLVPLK